MKLKKLESYLDFITAVQTCKGDVSFSSAEGDHLNLRSTFCQILFASVCTDRDFLSGGEILCSRPSDYERIKDFLEEDTD